MCGVYSRAAIIREQRLFLSVNVSLIKIDTTDEEEEGDPFADIEEDENELEENELVLDNC